MFSDYVVVGSDSGRIVILEYIPSKNQFDKIHQETFGKSGCRRIVPGQYLAVDPKGRAVMIGRLTSFGWLTYGQYLAVDPKGRTVVICMFTFYVYTQAQIPKVHIAKVCAWLSEQHQLTVQSDRDGPLVAVYSCTQLISGQHRHLVSALLVPQLLVLKLCMPVHTLGTLSACPCCCLLQYYH